jgi:hypothetical protein
MKATHGHLIVLTWVFIVFSPCLANSVEKGEPVVTVTTVSNAVDFGGDQMTSDLPGGDGLVSLHEAIIATNNTDGDETIEFELADDGGTGRILIVEEIPAIAPVVGRTRIDGGDVITLDGSDIPTSALFLTC